MPSLPFPALSARYVVLSRDDIDTDQIIPARYLKTTERTGLGAHAFAGWRYRADGTLDPGFALNRPEARGAQVLVTGRNFGCGSSREHAVWALLDAGFRAVVSAEFADIFRGNALGNGLLPIQVPPTVVARLAARDARSARVAVDLAAQSLTLADGESVAFPITPFAKHCLLHGIDALDFLLESGEDVERYERTNPAYVSTCHSPAEVGR